MSINFEPQLIFNLQIFSNLVLDKDETVWMFLIIGTELPRKFKKKKWKHPERPLLISIFSVCQPNNINGSILWANLEIYIIKVILVIGRLILKYIKRLTKKKQNKTKKQKNKQNRLNNVFINTYLMALNAHII